ncbi:MAG: acyl carrier protein [Lachnospiraceae bacterium]|nr:acyl carrier protein [Lachnospiraceae bacterium]
MSFDELKDLIVEMLSVDEDQVTPDANLVDDLGADSLSIVELHMEIEEQFGVKIPDEEVEKLHTVQDILDAVEAHKE